jgi:hypothetical protein
MRRLLALRSQGVAGPLALRKVFELRWRRVQSLVFVEVAVTGDLATVASTVIVAAVRDERTVFEVPATIFEIDDVVVHVDLSQPICNCIVTSKGNALSPCPAMGAESQSDVAAM